MLYVCYMFVYGCVYECCVCIYIYLFLYFLDIHSLMWIPRYLISLLDLKHIFQQYN